MGWSMNEQMCTEMTGGKDEGLGGRAYVVPFTEWKKRQILCQRLSRLHRALCDLPGNLTKVVSPLLGTFSLCLREKCLKSLELVQLRILQFCEWKVHSRTNSLMDVLHLHSWKTATLLHQRLIWSNPSPPHLHRERCYLTRDLLWVFVNESQGLIWPLSCAPSLENVNGCAGAFHSLSIPGKASKAALAFSERLCNFSPLSGLTRR